MTAPDRMPEAFENSLHDAGHPHMEPPANPGRFNLVRTPVIGNSPPRPWFEAEQGGRSIHGAEEDQVQRRAQREVNRR